MALKLVMVLVLSLSAFATGGKLPRTVPIVTFEPHAGIPYENVSYLETNLKVSLLSLSYNGFQLLLLKLRAVNQFYNDPNTNAVLLVFSQH